MQGFVITNKGLESVSALEIEELLNIKAEINETVVLFDIKNDKELCKLCYLGRSFEKVIQLFKNFKFKEIGDILKNLDLDFSFLKKRSFAVRCKRIDEQNIHKFTSKDIEREIGALILKRSKAKVDLKNPNITFFAYIYNNNFYFGIDYSGFDLSKRDYKVFMHPTAIKGTVAYALIRIAGWNNKKVLLDPFCGSATIPIEGALYGLNIPLFRNKKEQFEFTKFNFSESDKTKINKLRIFASDNNPASIKGAELNAKAAEVYRYIKFLKADIEWLDTKFEKESIDCIVTNPPKLDDFAMKKLFNEFFNHANFILKNDGNITMLLKNQEIAEKTSKENGFQLTKKTEIALGKEKRYILRFEKTKI